MARKGVMWGGQYYTVPQAASVIDSSALARSPLGGAGILVILGEMIGLVPPKTPTPVGSPSLARTLINPVSEEALLASQLVFDPSPDVPGASQVFLLPVNPATQAAATLVDGAASAALTLTSYMYGLPACQIKRKIENGSTTGKKISIVFGANSESFDNVSKSSLSVLYTGTGTAATMTVDVSPGNHVLTTAVTGAANDNLALDLLVYTTVQALADAINATGKYTATVLTPSPHDSSMSFDSVAAQDIKGAAHTVKSDLQALVDTVNSKSAYCTATRAAGATAVPANSDWAYLTGGTNGITTNTDWQTAFDVLRAMQADVILLLTNDASIHAMGDAHCSYMSGPAGKRERRQFVGGALQNWGNPTARIAAATALLGAAAALNSDRTVHATLGSYHYDPDGNPKLYPAYITAALYAGVAAGARPSTPLTRVHIRCLGLETNLQAGDGGEEGLLIDGGLSAPVPDEVPGGGYLISRQVTTWNQDANLYRIEFSVGRGADYTAAQIRLKHLKLVGQPGDVTSDASLINMTNGTLQELLDAGIIRSYNPKLTQIRINGAVRYVDYSAEPILPINFVFSTYHTLSTVLTVQL